MDKKEIQRRRMMSYFIDAAKQIIEEEGLEGITVRKVADIAGYNSATLYNYFENLDHLVFFASMQHLRDYVQDLPNYLNSASNALDKYLKIWKCFAYHSFHNPKIYHLIFFDKFKGFLNDAVKEYYRIFPEELGESSEELMPMLLENNIYARDLAALQSCVAEGVIKKENIYLINEMNVLLYQGMLQRIINDQLNYSVDEAIEHLLNYIRQVIKSYQIT